MGFQIYELKQVSYTWKRSILRYFSIQSYPFDLNEKFRGLKRIIYKDFSASFEGLPAKDKFMASHN